MTANVLYRRVLAAAFSAALALSLCSCTPAPDGGESGAEPSSAAESAAPAESGSVPSDEASSGEAETSAPDPSEASASGMKPDNSGTKATTGTVKKPQNTDGNTGAATGKITVMVIDKSATPASEGTTENNRHPVNIIKIPITSIQDISQLFSRTRCQKVYRVTYG